MIYEFKCDNCNVIKNLRLKLEEYEGLGPTKLVCSDCTSGQLVRYFGTPVGVFLPGNMTHDGASKVLAPGLNGTKQTSRVPLTLVTEKPDGSINVKYIGDKKKIENP